ncbi:hypothetical protein MKJ01_16065 [Chryseobacterium sp. SSA4.19]|uniref:hypothetical protein n=1 Tax=Chryseobacterium sp. SSA4.19 TaxID=2919915 RepID=UPI001F4D4889|nr:hypothetical protein [Chryseobacterium sp. SSA4.19]MCJ8155281.1 hypothetical protein [Chryseobacterium sp. SSA4.19]
MINSIENSHKKYPVFRLDIFAILPFSAAKISVQKINDPEMRMEMKPETIAILLYFLKTQKREIKNQTFAVHVKNSFPAPPKKLMGPITNTSKDA